MKQTPATLKAAKAPSVAVRALKLRPMGVINSSANKAAGWTGSVPAVWRATKKAKTIKVHPMGAVGLYAKQVGAALDAGNRDPFDPHAVACIRACSSHSNHAVAGFEGYRSTWRSLTKAAKST